MSDISRIQIDNTVYYIKDANAARKDSPILEGLPQAPRYGSGGTITEPIATIGYVDNAFKANDAMLFKGTIGSSGASVTTLPATHEVGWTYKVATLGTYAEQECEVGDLIICTTAGTIANNAHWTVVQENVNFDDVPTENSINSVKSGGVYSAIEDSSVFNEASGSIVSFDDGIEAPVGDLKVSIEPIQEGEGDPSPSNVRPITGWTGCNVVVSPTNSAQDGTTYDISFGEAGTVYGGSLDVPNGVLTVTHTLWSTNDRPATDPTAVSTSNNITQFWLYAGISGGINRTYFDGVKCDSLIYNQSGNISNTFLTKSTYPSSINIYMPSSLVGTTRGSINTYLNAHPMNFWVKLATPITYQLTPTEVTTLLGQNNIWADTGDISVVYCKNSQDGTLAGKVLKNLNTVKQDKLTFDSIPIQESLNPVTSEGIKSALDLKADTSTMETELNNKQDNIIKVASGNIANFKSDTDRNYADVKVDIEPVQNLHGYDHPWPAGGGKNLFTFTPKTETTNGVTFTWNEDGTVTATGVVTSGRSNAQQYVPITLPSGNYYFNGAVNEDVLCYIWCDTNYNKAKKWDDSPGVNNINNNFQEVKIEEGKEYQFVCYIKDTAPSDTYTFKPMICASTETDPTFEPYSNICPIEGWTSAKVQRTGKNLIVMDTGYSKTAFGVTVTVNADGTITLNGTCTVNMGIAIWNFLDRNSNVNKQSSTHHFPYGNYKFGSTPENVAIQVFGSDVIGSKENNSYYIGASNYSTTFTINRYKYHYVRLFIGNNATYDNVTFTPAIYFASDVNENEPYQNNVYSISFPSEAGTVYGGSLDVSSGTLTVDREIVYLKDLSWTLNALTEHAFNSLLPARMPIQNFNISQRGKNTSNCYTLWSSSVTAVDGLAKHSSGFAFGGGITNKTVYVKDVRATTIEEITALFTAENSYIIYELATPITYHLTPQQIQAFLGVNNVWADTGDTTVKYWSDTAIQTYVDNMVHASSNDEYKRYGVSGVGESASALTRIYDAVGMVAQVGTDGDNSGVRNDFDYAPPFMRRKCVGNWTLEDGHAVFHVQAYYGDEGYTEDGTKGDYVAVECPRCYYLREGDKLVVSAHQYPGYRPFDIFCKNHNPQDTMPFVYLPAYALAMKDGKAVSLPGLDNEQGCYYDMVTRARTYADGEVGTKAMTLPFAVNFYEYCLTTIEFAEQNSDNILKGCTSLRHNNDDNCTFVDSTHVLVNNWQTTRVVGEYVAIIGATEDRNLVSRQATHRIKSITRCDSSGNASSSGSYTKIEVEDLGKGYFNYEISTTYRFAARPWRTGETNGVSTPSGSPVNNLNGYYPMKYRWRENVWGNQWTTSMDLFNTREGTSDSDWTLDWYFLPDPEEYTPSASSKPDATELKADSPFIKLSLTTPHTKYQDGYIKSKKFSGLYSDVWIPNETGSPASGTTYYADYAFLVSSSSVRSVRFGGPWASGTNAGSSLFSGSNPPSYSYAISGAHLYIKQG